MPRRTFVALVAAIGVCLALPEPAAAETDQSGYASVNGLEMVTELLDAPIPESPLQEPK
jgi:hypothetical protein